MPYLEATLLEIQRMANTCKKCFEYSFVAISSTSIGLYVLFPVSCIILFSVTFSLPHVAKRDTKLQGFDIPKDAIIIANLYSAHIDEKYWKDPEKFKPERFLNEDGSLRRRDAFIPFSAGIFSLPTEDLRIQSFLLKHHTFILVIFLHKITVYSYTNHILRF